MRKIHFFIVIGIILWGDLAISQSFKILNDPAIVGQHKRMVFQKWGEWYPKPVYKTILWWETGIQTNVAASAIWGYNLYGIPSMITPKRNKRYKNGRDIRPLKPTGLQNQRYGEREMEYNEAIKIRKEVKDLKAKSRRDFAHWSAGKVDISYEPDWIALKLLVSNDPLWLLYYKKMLKPLRKFPANPKSFLDWQLNSPEIYLRLKKTGAIKHLQEELDLLKHNYKVSRNVDMPRGKRILLYHKTLLDWRNFEKKLKAYNKEAHYAIKVRSKLKKSKKSSMPHTPKSDTKIVRKVIQKYEKSYKF